ncbi:MAG: hypothetical protein QXZ17_05615 [Nitrososphaerota archaeon]
MPLKHRGRKDVDLNGVHTIVMYKRRRGKGWVANILTGKTAKKVKETAEKAVKKRRRRRGKRKKS